MKRVVFAFVLMFFAIPAMAQEVTVTSKLKPTYVGAQGGVFYGDPVAQSDVFMSWDNGMFLDIWTSTGFNTEMRFDKETDLVFGYSSFFVIGLNRIDYTVDTQYYFVQGIDVANANIELRLGPIFGKVEGYAPTQKGGPPKGIISSVGLRQSLDLSPRFNLSLEEKVKHDSGAFGFDEAWLAQGKASLNVNLSERTAVSTGVTLSKPITHMDDGREEEAVWEIGISRRFGD